MNYKEFAENAHIVYTLYVEVNGEKTGRIQALSEDGLLEQLHKLPRKIENELLAQYEDIAE